MRLLSFKDLSIKRSIFYSLILVISLSIVMHTSVWLISENQEMKDQVAELIENELFMQRNYLRLKVENTIEFIEFKIKYEKDKSEAEIKDEILEWFAQHRLIYDGYIFINTIEGQALLFDGKRVEGYKNISEMTDPKGLRIFDIEKEGYYSDDGKFIEYLFKPMESDIPEEKISYMQGFKPWGWIVGAGIYKRKPTLQIELEKKNYYQSFVDKIWSVAYITLILLFLGYLIVKWIDKLLNSQVILLQDSLRNIHTTGNFIDLLKFKFLEFKIIGSSINQMIDEKKNLEKSLAEADQSLKLVFQVAKDVAFVVVEPIENNFLIKAFSPGAEKIFGYSNEEIINQKAEILAYPKALPEVENILKKLENEGQGASGEIICSTKENQPFAAFYNVHLFKKPNGSPGLMAVIIDISESKKTADELEKLKNNLEIKVEERTREIILKSDLLKEQNKELEYYNKLFIGREFRINELKQKIKELETKLGQQNGQPTSGN